MTSVPRRGPRHALIRAPRRRVVEHQRWPGQRSLVRLSDAARSRITSAPSRSERDHGGCLDRTGSARAVAWSGDVLAEDCRGPGPTAASSASAEQSTAATASLSAAGCRGPPRGPRIRVASLLPGPGAGALAEDLHGPRRARSERPPSGRADPGRAPAPGPKEAARRGLADPDPVVREAALGDPGPTVDPEVLPRVSSCSATTTLPSGARRPGHSADRLARLARAVRPLLADPDPSSGRPRPGWIRSEASTGRPNGSSGTWPRRTTRTSERWPSPRWGRWDGTRRGARAVGRPRAGAVRRTAVRAVAFWDRRRHGSAPRRVG